MMMLARLVEPSLAMLLPPPPPFFDALPPAIVFSCMYLNCCSCHRSRSQYVGYPRVFVSAPSNDIEDYGCRLGVLFRFLLPLV